MNIRHAVIRAIEILLQVLPLSLRIQLVKRLRQVLPGAVLFELGWPSMAGSLENLHRRGYRPKAIVDVGAHHGDWARMATRSFGKVPIAMVDADPVNTHALRAAAHDLGATATYHLALLGAESRAGVPFYSMGMGSSVLEELTKAQRSVLELPMQKLDDVLNDWTAPSEGSLLFKLDVQGYELEVLRGAAKTLARADVVILEVAFREYNRGAPLLQKVLDTMAREGFVADEIAGMSRRRIDGALLQMDFVFVREGHPLRTQHASANEPV